ncbi:hypothetical protein RHS01_03071, partial [Rhizoctonia solani]
MAPRPRRYLPHGFQEKATPMAVHIGLTSDHSLILAGTRRYIKTPLALENVRLPKGVERHYTPSGSVYYVDSRPRASWVDPRTVDFNIDTEREEYAQNSTMLFTGGEYLEPPPDAHIEFRLLMDLTKWRLAQSLSGYPDSRIDEVDTLIEMLNARISACPDLNKLKPMGGAFIRACYRHISSEADMTAYGPSNKANLTPETPTYAWLAFKFIMYAILLGAPLNYAHRLKKADWVQWSSRHRWTDQQRALDGFLKSLTNEWNLINLTVGVRHILKAKLNTDVAAVGSFTTFVSAAVGLLTVEGLSTISQNCDPNRPDYGTGGP